jgi:hypothetical protein
LIIGDVIFEIRNLDTSLQTSRLLSTIYSHLGLTKAPLPNDLNPQYSNFSEIDKDLVVLTKNLTAAIRYKTLFGAECVCPGCGCPISSHGVQDDYEQEDDM